MRAWDGALVLAYVLYALIAAAFLVVNMPPYQNADETNHFLRADNISRFHLIGHRFGQGDGGGIASPEIDRSGKPFDWPKFYPERKVTRSMYAGAAAKFGEPGRDITFRNTAIYPPFFYAPSVAAIWIGKAGRLDVVQTLYLARLLTALVSGALIVSALLVCSAVGATGAAVMIFAAATLPMALSIQSACSQDGPMLGAAALAAALFTRLRLAPRSRGFALMSVCLALIAAARPSYVFLALVPLAAPVGWGAKLRGAALVVISCLLWVLAANAYATTAMTERGANLSEQFLVLLDPARDLDLLARTFDVSGWAYLNQLIGQLGWLDVTLPAWLIQAAAGLLLLTALAGIELRSSSFIPVLGSVLLSTICVFVLIYLTWDKVGDPTIEGVQGRYFLPLLMTLAGLATTIARPPLGPIAYVAAMAFPVISLGETMRIIVLRYYLGP